MVLTDSTELTLSRRGARRHDDIYSSSLRAVPGNLCAICIRLLLLCLHCAAVMLGTILGAWPALYAVACTYWGGGTERRPTVLGSALPLDSLFSLGGGGRGGVCVCVHLCSCPRVIGCGPAGGDVQPHNTFVFFHCFFLIDIFAICVQSGHLFAARRCCGGGCPPCAGLSLSHFISFHFFSRFAFSLKRPPAHRWAFVCR